MRVNKGNRHKNLWIERKEGRVCVCVREREREGGSMREGDWERGNFEWKKAMQKEKKECKNSWQVLTFKDIPQLRVFPIPTIYASKDGLYSGCFYSSKTVVLLGSVLDSVVSN